METSTASSYLSVRLTRPSRPMCLSVSLSITVLNDPLSFDLSLRAMSSASVFSFTPLTTAPESLPPCPASMMTVRKFLGPGLCPS